MQDRKLLQVPTREGMVNSKVLPEVAFGRATRLKVPVEHTIRVRFCEGGGRTTPCMRSQSCHCRAFRLTSSAHEDRVPLRAGVVVQDVRAGAPARVDDLVGSGCDGGGGDRPPLEAAPVVGGGKAHKVVHVACVSSHQVLAPPPAHQYLDAVRPVGEQGEDPLLSPAAVILRATASSQSRTAAGATHRCKRVVIAGTAEQHRCFAHAGLT